MNAPLETSSHPHRRSSGPTELTPEEIELVSGGSGLAIAAVGFTLAVAGRILVASPVASSLIGSASVAVGMLGLAMAIDDAKEGKSGEQRSQPDVPKVPNVPAPIPEGPSDPYSLGI